jgi:hypothetical protein
VPSLALALPTPAVRRLPGHRLPSLALTRGIVDIHPTMPVYLPYLVGGAVVSKEFVDSCVETVVCLCEQDQGDFGVSNR